MPSSVLSDDIWKISVSLSTFMPASTSPDTSDIVDIPDISAFWVPLVISDRADLSDITSSSLEYLLSDLIGEFSISFVSDSEASSVIFIVFVFASFWFAVFSVVLNNPSNRSFWGVISKELDSETAFVNFESSKLTLVISDIISELVSVTKNLSSPYFELRYDLFLVSPLRVLG